MKLGRLQEEFCAYLLDRSASVEAEAIGDMEVYHHAYRAQLQNCLRDTFEKSWSWLGDEAFEAAALAHIEAHPPSSWTLNLYGDDFSQTLAGRYPDDPEIAELAWLEWSLRRAFDGPDSGEPDPKDLAEIDWDNAILHLVPTLTLRSIASNCAAIWSTLAEGRPPPPAETLPVPMAIRVWKQGLTPKFRTIEAFELKALRLIVGGADFAGLCAVLDNEQEIGRCLGSWLQDGVIAAITDHPADRLPFSPSGA
jgi:hypothetical protein